MLINVLVAANEAFERLASLGLMPNMILYLTREYGMQTAGATNFLLLWSAASNFTPFVGAVLADSYVGRYSMIAFGSIASLLVIFFLFSCNEGFKLWSQLQFCHNFQHCEKLEGNVTDAAAITILIHCLSLFSHWFWECLDEHLYKHL